MDPTIWGPKAWFFLHSVTLAYPDNPSQVEQNNIYHFFMSLKGSLPCKACKDHYANYVGDGKQLRTLQDRKDMIEWLIILHNKINALNNKKQWSVRKSWKNINQNTKLMKTCWSIFFCIKGILMYALLFS